MISSPDPIERVLEPGDVKDGCFEVKEDVKCLTKVRAARMFPFWRCLRKSEFGIFRRMSKIRTGVPHEEQNGPGSFQKTNLPSSQPTPSHYPVFQRPRDEVRPRRTRPLVISRSRNSSLATIQQIQWWYLCRAIPRRSVGDPGLRLARVLSSLSI